MISEAEDKIRASIEVHSVSEVDEISFDSYAEIQDLYRRGRLDIGCRMNESVVDNFGTRGQRIMDRILLSSPVIVILASIVLAVVRAEYVLLVGIPIALLGMFMTTPAIMRSGRGFGGTVLAIVFIAFVIACFKHHTVAALLLGAYWIPNFLLTVSREQNRMVMTEAVMTSELAFLYYFLRGDVRVTRNKSANQAVDST